MGPAARRTADRLPRLFIHERVAREVQHGVGRWVRLVERRFGRLRSDEQPAPRAEADHRCPAFPARERQRTELLCLDERVALLGGWPGHAGIQWIGQREHRAGTRRARPRAQPQPHRSRRRQDEVMRAGDGARPAAGVSAGHGRWCSGPSATMIRRVTSTGRALNASRSSRSWRRTPTDSSIALGPSTSPRTIGTAACRRTRSGTRATRVPCRVTTNRRPPLPGSP